MTEDTLLIGLGARFYRSDGRLYVEDQTISGLQAWQEHFAHVVAFSICEDRAPPQGWSDADLSGLRPPCFAFVPLPDTYRWRTMVTTHREARKVLCDWLSKTDYRVFSYGGAPGDPGEIAASAARRLGLAHAVWLDRVESQVVMNTGGLPPHKTLLRKIMAKVIARNERRAVRQADLALLHGRTVFDQLRRFSGNPQIAENIHVHDADRIGADALGAKIRGLSEGPVRILYCGRAHPMKGGMSWIAVLAALKQSGRPFAATWLGGGEQLAEMKNAARSSGLTEQEISFPGFEVDRQKVMQHYRDAHILLFCHMTDESPRNLIESLHAGTPLLGFRDPYSQGLVDEQGAGALVARGDVSGLAEAVARYIDDREALADLVAKAGRSASHLTRDAVFGHRSALVRRYLTPQSGDT